MIENKTDKGKENMKKILIVLFCLLGMSISYAKESIKDEQDDIAPVVQKFKEVIKTDNPEIIANYIEYPYSRYNPLPDIENKEDFINNYELIFDDWLKQVITDSKLEDWDKVGWRGIMLHRGLVWINKDGKLKAINYHPDKAKEYAVKWYQNDKASIYEPLREYDENVAVFKTDTKLGRIDKIDIDEYNSQYRLALWDNGSDMSVKPDVLISDGTVEYFGSANNTEYRFKSGDYKYVFFINYVGPMDMKPYELGIYRNAEENAEEFNHGKQVAFEEAHLVK